MPITSCPSIPLCDSAAAPRQDFATFKIYSKHKLSKRLYAITAKMDPIQSMSTAGGNVPAGFNADDAGNMEDVGGTKHQEKKKSEGA